MSWPRRACATLHYDCALARFLLCLAPVVAFDAWFVRGILAATGGRLCPILDDAFIHYQYARSFSELHPLSYHPGDPPTTGATSVLYPALLGVGHRLGFHELTLSWFAHGLSAVFVAWSMVVAWGFAERVVHRAVGPVAALSVIACPTYLLFCLGGMEIGVSTSTQLVATLWAASFIMHRERRIGREGRRRALALCFVGGLAALGRPEGAVAAGFAALALLAWPVESCGASRWLALPTLAPIALPGLIAYATTGMTRTNGMLLKLVFANPYATRDDVMRHAGANGYVLWNELFAGRPVRNLVVYPALPSHFRVLLVAGLVALLLLFVRRAGRRGLVAWLGYTASAACIFSPIFYTWLGNLGRYVYAFVPLFTLALPLGVAGLITLLGERSRRDRRFVGLAAFAVGLGLALVFVVSPRAARAEHVEAAREICAQQVRMAEAVRDLPRDAVVAINDAGAIAYLGGHRTWDMVGLTSHDAALSRLAGVGGVFERMERLAPGRRPTHLAYYHWWFPGLRIAGRHLFRASVSGIYVGGRDKDLEVIREELFGSGARPRSTPSDIELVDELDIADVASEAAHRYEGPGVRQDGAFFRLDDSAAPLAEGGRALGAGDRFELHASAGAGRALAVRRILMRLRVLHGGKLEVRWNGEPIATFELRSGPRMIERAIELDPAQVREVNIVERRALAGARIEVFHDWLSL